MFVCLFGGGFVGVCLFVCLFVFVCLWFCCLFVCSFVVVVVVLFVCLFSVEVCGGGAGVYRYFKPSPIIQSLRYHEEGGCIARFKTFF